MNRPLSEPHSPRQRGSGKRSLRLRVPEPRSLRLRLLAALLVTLLPLAVVGAYVDYRTARSLLKVSHDKALASTAIGLAARVEVDRDGDLPAHLSAGMHALSRLGESDGLVYLVLDGKGQRLGGDPRLTPFIKPKADSNPAFHNISFMGQAMRAASYQYVGPDGSADIIVAEGLAKRTADAQRVLLPAMVANLVTGLAMMLSAVIAVGFALMPLDALGLRVEGHEVQALRPVRLRGLPSETRPLVRAINRLMARLRRTTQARQQFIDNTAHQLRTPLASLQAQAALLAAEPLPPAAKVRVQQLQTQVQRLAHLAHQMLALSRASHESADGPADEPVHLPGLLQQVASACLDAALAKGMDLGFEADAAVVTGSPWMLHELLLNLVDNAIRYAPVGSAVTVRCGLHEGSAFLEVEDAGPGIAPADRVRVFNRHVRLAEDAGNGSGLGMAIVRHIAQRHAARVELRDGAGGRGLRVRVDFEAQRPGAAAPASTVSVTPATEPFLPMK